MKSKISTALIAVFFLIPFILLLGSIISPDKESSEKENRSLAQLPKLNITSLSSGDFMTRFESYMSDQIFGREKIVSAKTVLDRLAGKTEQNGVYIGRDGWLFEKQSGFDSERINETTEAIRSFCEKCKIENQMFVLVPDSTSVVTEKLPANLSFDSQSEQIKNVHSALPDNVKCLDADKIIHKAHDVEALYYKTDHHWTAQGAKLVFDGIAEEWGFDAEAAKFKECILSDSFYGTLSSSSGIKDKADIIKAYIPEKSAGTYIVQNSSEETSSASLFDLSKLETGNQYEVFLGGNFAKLTVTTDSDTENRLLLFKDSYANTLLPMLTPYFSEIVIVDPRYYTDDIKNVVDGGDFTHLMFLYNVNTFLDDTSIKDVLK